MPKNPGNSGHRGYKMSRVVNIEPRGDYVAVSLECGHVDLWLPYFGWSSEAWAVHIQQGAQPIIVGTTRLRCREPHSPQKQ